jgi:folate-dependent phosphoribosylglycinamide formyltransferase PurN
MSAIVLLCTPCRATNVLYHAIAARFAAPVVIAEDPVSRAELVKRRVKRLGPVRVAGQLAFQTLVSPYLARSGAARNAAILREAALSDAPVPDSDMRHVASVNTPEAREALRAAEPRVVVVSGTRIIGRETLAAVDAPFVNLHAGITPRYRGVHGAFWALAEGRPDLAGATVHLVDTGIDTGGVIAHAPVTPTAEDSFATYPMLQLVAGVPPLLAAVEALLAGTSPLGPTIANEHAPLRYHPTLWEYAAARLAGRAR